LIHGVGIPVPPKGAVDVIVHSPEVPRHPKIGRENKIKSAWCDIRLL